MSKDETLSAAKIAKNLAGIAMLFLIVAIMGCATVGTEKYVGTWAGRSAKANDGVMVRLDEGGGGYAATFVGAVPLKWRETDANRLDVRFGCGDGFLFFYDLSYSPEKRTLRLMHEKTVCLRDGNVSNERAFDDMVLCRSNEYAKAMAPSIEHAEKIRAANAKSGGARHHGPSEMITNDMVLATWEDVGQLGKALHDGWSVSFFADGCCIPCVSIHPWPSQGRGSFTIFSGQFVVGDPEDKCDFETPRRHGVCSLIEAVPPSATPFPGATWDAASEADTLGRIRNKGWTPDRVAYYEEHFFYGIFRINYNVQTGDMPVDEVVGSLQECLGGAMKPPFKVHLWKKRPRGKPGPCVLEA